jgi:hypothetical protein
MIKVQGMPDTAMLMEMSESALDNRVYERKNQGFTVRESIRLQQISCTTKFAEEIASISGGTFVKLPEIESIGNDDLLSKFNALHAQIGRLSQRFSEATEDGEVDKRERTDLAAIGDEIHRATQELLALTFRIYCRTEPK